MSARRVKIILLLIFLLFISTRLYKLNNIPPSVYWDEASIGYNAYSIVQTGKDEKGRFIPLDFEAFGEYKLPIYIYTTALSVKAFGLNEFAVRIPAVLFSLGVVIFSFFLAKKLTKNNSVGLLTAFFVTTSQWFFIISRTGFEATAGLLFYVSGLYFFFSAIEEKKYFLIISIICFILTLYSYNSFLIITPISLLFLIIFYLQQLKAYVKKNLILIIICLAILIVGGFGVINSVISGRIARLDEVGISGAYNHRKYQTVITVISNYFSHFSHKFLFFEGDGNGRTQQPHFGQINLIFLPLLILGSLYCLREKKEYRLVLFLLLIAPIPASVTRESPHALRSISAVPFIALISSLGVLKLTSMLNNNLYTKVVIGSTLIAFLSYFQIFIFNYTKETSNDWQYPLKVINTAYAKEFNNFDNIVISDRYNQPYIFTLFYQEIDPDKFRSQVQYNTSIRKATSLVNRLDKIIFTNVDYYQLPKGRSLIFTHPTDKMDEFKWKETILNPDGSIGAYVYEYER